MLEMLQKIDASLFYFFNVSLANPFFDLIMPILTEKSTWFPVWIIVAVCLLSKGGKTGRWALLLAILAVAISDYVSASVLKPMIGRIRPCNVEPVIHLIGKKKSSFSFPSAHAANFFAIATVFSYFYDKYQSIFWFFAVVVAFSRIAIGVHYPFDVAGGAFLGLLTATALLTIYKTFLSRSQTKIEDEL